MHSGLGGTPVQSVFAVIYPIEALLLLFFISTVQEPMMESEHERLLANLAHIEERIEKACAASGRSRDSVRLIAVTKTHPVETVQALIDIGIREIGENRVQEILLKAPQLKGDFVLHMIGHLQTNKVDRLLPHVGWIQSIDSERLVARIESCRTAGPGIPALVEVNTSGETSKSGCRPEECRMLCERVAGSARVELRGLMTIGPLGADEAGVRSSFALLRRLGEECRECAKSMELSMGMSDDFKWAIEEGSTMVRIGSALTGERTL
jgi:pyridoxal phosphate enzyme (YggS family)